MPKGYIIASINVTDPEVYAHYVKASTAAMALYGCKAIVRGGRHEQLEGKSRPRTVVLEFESYDAARAYYHSPEYQAAIPLRLPASEATLLLVEGA